MNTKQVLYNAISAQLEAKKIEAEKYDTEVYHVNTDTLISKVCDYFSNKVGGFDAFHFTGSNIKLELSSNWYDRIEIGVHSSWRDEKENATREIKVEWNSGNFSNKENSNNKGGASYIKLLNSVYNNFDEIVDKYLNEWYPEYLNNESEHNKAWKEHNDLKYALDKLREEIKQDSIEAMKQIGFEIKSFKDDVCLDWDYKDSDREYKIATRKRSIQLQHGRSQYDTTYAHGFKVLGKKGNKYKVEIYREDDQPARTYDVLEKKFESFIEDVCRWEDNEANKRKEKAERDYNDRLKK